MGMRRKAQKITRLNLIPILDDYFGTTIQFYPTCLPINANLNDRIKNLMRVR